jgi:ABC-2 type transport system ATP-binding protein
MVGLYERRNDPFKTYSLGMKQRLAIACALIADPELLIFDEPTNGLDPQGIADIRAMIMDIAKTGKTIILASHLLDEVQKVCTDFAVLRNGNKIFQGSVDGVLNQKQRIEVWAEDEDRLKSVLAEIPAIKSIHRQNRVYLCELSEELPAGRLNAHLFDKGIIASHLANVRSSLEEQFLTILREDD